MATNCIYKSVDLVAGEVFVLPPGAEIVSVTDDTVLESSCADTIFPVQERKCFQIRWAITYDSEGLINYFPLPFNPPIIIPEANNAWDNEGGDTPDISISQYGLAGQVYPMGISATDFAAMESAFVSSPVGSLLGDRKYNHNERESVDGVDSVNWNGDFHSGYNEFVFTFRAVQEVADTFYLQFFGASGNIGSVPRYYAQEIDCADYPTTTEVASGGNPFAPAPSTTTTTTS